MSIVLVGSTSGSITLQEPAVAGTTTLTLPATTGTVVVGSSAVSAAGQIPFSTDGSTYTPTAKIVSGTAVASTSGTSIDFTGIPSWTKRVTVMFNGVSTVTTSNYLIQIGSGSISNTGYTSLVSFTGAGTGRVSSTSGFICVSAVGTQSWSGQLIITLVSGNVYVQSGCVADGADYTETSSGTKTLSGVLDRVRITTVGGTDTFDAGSINILYE